jgi:hypothetical protein
MNYYRHISLAKKGEQPEASAIVTQGRYATWEGRRSVGEFADKNKFTADITDLNGPVGSVKGSGSNAFHGFVCRQDDLHVLYRNKDKICKAVLYCQP